MFEVAILESNKMHKGEVEKPEKLLYGPKAVLAKDDKVAAMKTIMENAAALAEADSDRIQVIVRPFA